MKKRQAMLLLGVSLLICTALRIMQLIFTIDRSTGFIKKPYATISVLITVIVCVVTAAVSLLSFTGDAVFKKSKENVLLTSASFLMGGAFLARGVIGVLSLQNKGLGDVLLVFLAIVSAVVFVMYGLQSGSEKANAAIIFVVPVIYYVAELISIFVSTSSLALVTENIFIIFSTCASLLFVFMFAGFENEIKEISKAPKKLFATAIAAIMLCALTAFPKTFLALAGEIQLSKFDLSQIILQIAMGVFALAYVICNLDDKFVDKKYISKHSV